MKKVALEIRAILKSRSLGLSIVKIAEQTGIPKTTIQRMLATSTKAELTITQANAMTDQQLESIFSPARRQKLNFEEPDWEDIYLKHARKSKPVELTVLWEDYKKSVTGESKPLSYSAFCKNYKEYVRGLPTKLKDVTMTFHWSPADVCMIDYSGNGVVYHSPDGKKHTAQIFVGVLPHSGYMFTYATPDQTRSSWIKAIAEMFEFFGGVPSYIFLDNSTSLVKKANKFNPVVSDEFTALCNYYHTVPYPCRPYEPRDKALVENCVGLIQRKILNPLEGEFFSSIEEINKTLKIKLEDINNKPMVEKMQSRKEIFEEEVKLLQPVPKQQFNPGIIIKTLKVRQDYRIRYQNRRFSVPYKYAGQIVKVVIYPDQGILDCFDLRTGDRIAHHRILSDSPDDIFCMEHMPEKHLAVARTIESLIDMIGLGGKNSKELAVKISKQNSKRIAHRLLTGLSSNQNRLGNQLFEECCKETLNRPNPNYENLIKEIDRKLGGNKTTETEICDSSNAKENVRGSEYYEERMNKKGIK